jgi:hypothetical protein
MLAPERLTGAFRPETGYDDYHTSIRSVLEEMDGGISLSRIDRFSLDHRSGVAVDGRSGTCCDRHAVRSGC